MQIFLVGSVVGTHTYILVYFHKLFHFSFSKGIWIKLACFGWKNSQVTFFGLWSGLLQIFFIVAYKAHQCLQYSYWSKFDCPTQSPKTLLCERRGKTIRTGGGTVLIFVQEIKPLRITALQGKLKFWGKEDLKLVWNFPWACSWKVQCLPQCGLFSPFVRTARFWVTEWGNQILTNMNIVGIYML